MKIFKKNNPVVMGNSNVVSDGKTVVISGSGRNVSIINGRVFIDGVEMKSDEKVIYRDVVINGDPKSVMTQSGSIRVNGNVTGDVSSTSGDVEISGSVEGNVHTTSGDVRVRGGIQGSVSTVSGDIN